uniref:C2H2-type domain-containing protein n=1 Tax=Mimivirus LCMiAC02 TaxID=2506609 RepID=A0A481Z0N1_9VIRU|nr:MAG: uncharacterized protein LCMiAC02_01550 [Mimivirus LCMiAC02]
MVSYKCDKCNKIFTHKNDYRRHINRKRPCVPITKITKNLPENLPKNDRPYECSLCSKTYKLKHHLHRHIIQSCKAKTGYHKNGKILESSEEDTSTINYNNPNDSTNGVYDDQEYIPPHKLHKPHKNAQHKSQYTCEYCEKMFTRRDTLVRHKKKYCKVRKENDENMTKLLNKLVMQMKNIEHENKKLRTDVSKIKGNTTNSTTHSNSHNTNTNTQNTTNVQNNINLLSFGKDNMENISDEEIKKILKRGFKSIQLLVKKTNFNPDIPENHNVYINNIKSQYAITYNKGRWKIDRTEDVIDRIYDDKYGFLEQKYHELKNELKPYDRKKIERILDEYEGVKKTKIFDNIKLVLYNNRHIPLKTRKMMQELMQ